MPDFSTPALFIEIFREAFRLFAVMAPYLLLGMVAAGIMHVLLPVNFVSRQLGQNTIVSVLKAGVLGVPIPLCSCGVVPVAASLNKNGASKGATVSFLVTTPTSGVDSMFATYSLLGWPIMVLRVVASFILGIIAGSITALLDKSTPASSGPAAAEKNATGNIAARVVNYAFFELYEGISKPLLLGSLLGGVVTALLPPTLLSETVSDGLGGMGAYLLMLGIGIPLYVCASGSIPLAAALLAKGISPGAAIIFLIAGPATNAATVTVISNMLGKKNLFIYLTVLTLGTLGAGIATDTLFGVFELPLPEAIHQHQHGGETLTWLEILSGAMLLGLSGYFLGTPIVRRWRRPKGDSMIEFTVNDMTCGHCAKTIENAICNLEGVKSVQADPDNKKVLIDAAQNTEEIVRKAIVDAGYTPE
ncbi:MAG: permease [Deltaproteobacteria bacterium]|nr:permease [Deltaproteobacteria bacterium]MBN2674089.1 permease [Deltaproteobacteria bacterium]